QDVFIAKLNPKGSALGFSTYLGGCNVDYGFGIRLDSDGNILVSGQTSSANASNCFNGTFPLTPGAFQTTFAGGETDGFVSKISNPCTAITLAPDTLPGAALGVNYSQTITAIGGSAPYDFVLTAGSLPSGFTLSSSGVISGKTTLA